MFNTSKHSRLRRAPALAAAVALTIGGVILGLAGGASAAGGTHTQTSTDNFHGAQTVVQVNPCTQNAVDISENTNLVNHVTYFPASDEAWGTFTEEDSFTATDQGTGVVYSGHDTFWGNFNVNRQNSNSTFTSTIRATGSDGSTIAYHEVGHFTLLPSGDISVSFDKPSLTCG
jgi:hypothetical protein